MAGKKKPKKGRLINKIGPKAKRILKAKNAKLTQKKRIKDYERDYDRYLFEDWHCPKYLHFYQGYDILENLYFARTYICKKYTQSLRNFEVLLFLYPKGYFTIEDYFPISHMGYEVRFPLYLVRQGLVKVVAYPKSEAKTLNKKKIDPRYVYTLSQKGKDIVEEFYGLLSGEIKYAETKEENPFFTSEKAIDQQRFRLAQKLNKMPVPESKKRLFDGRDETN